MCIPTGLDAVLRRPRSDADLSNFRRFHCPPEKGILRLAAGADGCSFFRGKPYQANRDRQGDT